MSIEACYYLYIYILQPRNINPIKINIKIITKCMQDEESVKSMGEKEH